jgi:RNA polymerase sigma factor (sigma-70 family)
LPALINLNDAELVGLLKKDDVKAFDTLYHRYFPALYRNVFLLTKDPVITQDILQEVFIALWDKRSGIDPRQSVSGWLFVTSYHGSVNWLRRRLRESALEERALEDSAASTGGIVGSAGTWAIVAVEREEREERMKLLNEAISRLSPQKRKVFELCKLEGKSYEETARELSLSKHTVKEYLSGAVQAIKQYIQQHHEYFSKPVDTGLFIWLSIGLANYFL